MSAAAPLIENCGDARTSELIQAALALPLRTQETLLVSIGCGMAGYGSRCLTRAESSAIAAAIREQRRERRLELQFGRRFRAKVLAPEEA